MNNRKLQRQIKSELKAEDKRPPMQSDLKSADTEGWIAFIGGAILLISFLYACVK